MSNNDNKK